jgi:Tfp pilus assembly protein PilV
MSPSIDAHRPRAPSRHRGLRSARWGRWASNRPALRRRSDDGVTLVEVLVASVLLLVTMIPMGIFLTSATSSAVATRQREAALQLADSWVEILANSDPPTYEGTVNVVTGQGGGAAPVLPAGVQPPPSTLVGTNYSVSAQYSINTVAHVGQSGLCAAGTLPSAKHPSVIVLTVDVAWYGGDKSKHTVSDSTEINYPKPGIQTEGFLAVTVTNSGVDQGPPVGNNTASDRLQAIPVTITQTDASPPVTYTMYPDSSGCIFAQLPTGTYNVVTGQPVSLQPLAFTGYSGNPPFVNTSGSTFDEVDGQTVTVTAETTVPLIAIDEGIYTNVSYGGASAVDQGVECPDGANITCITTGSASTGVEAAWGNATSAWNSSTLSTATHVNQVACTTAATAKCVGVGYGSGGGAILATSSDFTSPSPDSVPTGITDITQVTCPSTDGCYAIGTTGTAGVLLAGKVVAGVDHWANVTPTGTFTSMNSIACPTASTCELGYTGASSAPGIIRLDGDPAGLAPVVTPDTLAGTITSVGAIDCPSSNDCVAIANQSGSLGVSLITAAPPGSGSSVWGTETTFPTGATAISGLSCTSTTCVAVGTNTVGANIVPAVWTGDLTPPTIHNWAQATTFPSVSAVTSVACGLPAANDAADCVIAATQGSSAQLIDGSLANGSWAWNGRTPSGVSIQYFTGVSCENPASAASSTCAAVGSTGNGPIILATATGPAGTWTNQTSSSLNGATVTGIPLTIQQAGQTNWTTQVSYNKTPGANANKLPNVLYPQPGGYSIAAGDCSSEASSAPNAVFSAQPGGTATATVPLALLPIQLIGANGKPVSGAIVTLSATAPCSTDAYNLPVTDANGVTMTSVPYGTYTYTVTSGSVATAHPVTLNVGVNSVTVGPATYWSPQIVQLAA